MAKGGPVLMAKGGILLVAEIGILYLTIYKGECDVKKVICYFIAGIIILLVVLYACGFRITYAPELENSWNAISACAGWFGAIMSALALFVAIHIPKRIADQQDRIALFDKRFYAFSKLTFLLPVAREIISNISKDEAEKLDPWEILASGMQAAICGHQRPLVRW